MRHGHHQTSSLDFVSFHCERLEPIHPFKGNKTTGKGKKEQEGKKNGSPASSTASFSSIKRRRQDSIKRSPPLPSARPPSDKVRRDAVGPEEQTAEPGPRRDRWRRRSTPTTPPAVMEWMSNSTRSILSFFLASPLPPTPPRPPSLYLPQRPKLLRWKLRPINK